MDCSDISAMYKGTATETEPEAKPPSPAPKMRETKDLQEIMYKIHVGKINRPAKICKLRLNINFNVFTNCCNAF